MLAFKKIKNNDKIVRFNNNNSKKLINKLEKLSKSRKILKLKKFLKNKHLSKNNIMKRSSFLITNVKIIFNSL